MCICMCMIASSCSRKRMGASPDAMPISKLTDTNTTASHTSERSWNISPDRLSAQLFLDGGNPVRVNYMTSCTCICTSAETPHANSSSFPWWSLKIIRSGVATGCHTHHPAELWLQKSYYHLLFSGGPAPAPQMPETIKEGQHQLGRKQSYQEDWWLSARHSLDRKQKTPRYPQQCLKPATQD